LIIFAVAYALQPHQQQHEQQRIGIADDSNLFEFILFSLSLFLFKKNTHKQ